MEAWTDRHSTITARVLFCASDLLAAKKLVAVVGHSHRLHPCHQCSIPKSAINEPAGYDWRNLRAYPASVLLKHAFEYEHAEPDRRAEIEEDYGVRYSPLLRLIGIEHSKSSPVDPLHNSFLGIAKAFVNMLFRNSLFDEDQQQMFMLCFEKVSPD